MLEQCFPRSGACSQWVCKVNVISIMILHVLFRERSRPSTEVVSYLFFTVTVLKYTVETKFQLSRYSLTQPTAAP